MNNKTAVIIAGGLNTRINMIKPLINLGGKQLLIRIHDVLKEIFSEIILVIRQDQDGEIPDLGLALKMYVIEDEFPNKGPLSGIYSGLNSSINEEVFIIGADYPFLSKNFINYMSKLSEGKRSIFIKNREIINPLHAIYTKSEWQKIFLKNLNSDSQLSPKQIISKSKSNNLEFINYSKIKEEYKESLFDIDNLEDLKKAKQIITRKGHAIRPDIRPEGV